MVECPLYRYTTLRGIQQHHPCNDRMIWMIGDNNHRELVAAMQYAAYHCFSITLWHRLHIRKILLVYFQRDEHDRRCCISVWMTVMLWTSWKKKSDSRIGVCSHQLTDNYDVCLLQRNTRHFASVGAVVYDEDTWGHGLYVCLRICLHLCYVAF